MAAAPRPSPPARQRRLPILAAALLLLLAGSRGNAQSPAAQEWSADLEEAVSQERAAQGLKPVESSVALRKAAQAQAEDMARGGYFALEGPAGSPTLESLLDKEGYRYTLVTEKLVRAPREHTVEDLIAGWHAAPAANRSSLFLADARDIGVGMAESGDLRIVAIVLAAASAPEPPASPQAAAFSALARQPAAARQALYQGIAAQRRAWGLSPLRVDPLLGEAAERHAEDLLAALIAGRPADEVVPLADLVAEQRARSGMPVEASGEVSRQRRHASRGSNSVGDSVGNVIVTDATTAEEALAMALRRPASALREARHRVVAVGLAVRPPAGAAAAGHAVWVIALATH